MSVYSVTYRASASGVLMNNVFFYRTPNPALLEGSALDMLAIFDSTIRPAILTAVNAAHTAIGVDVFDLLNPANIASGPVAGVGARAGEALPPYVAAAARTNRATRLIRRGQKRFGPCSEGDSLGISWLAAYITVLDALAAVLDNPLAGAVTYTPIVVKRIFVPESGGVPAHYRLPTTSGELSYFDITSWEFNERPSSQVSRKLPYIS